MKRKGVMSRHMWGGSNNFTAAKLGATKQCCMQLSRQQKNPKHHVQSNRTALATCCPANS